MKIDKSKVTLVVGASENTSRYSNIAIKRLLSHQLPVLAVGAKKGMVENVTIESDFSGFKNIDTVTLYVGPQNQEALIPQIIQLKPRRIIFNPGTENPAFVKVANENGIETEIACTLVLLSLNSY
jgi:predicted CoA-binding protein